MSIQEVEELLCNAGWLPYTKRANEKEQAGLVVSLCPESGVGVHYLHVSRLTRLLKPLHVSDTSYAAVLVIPTSEVTSTYRGRLVQPEWLYCPNVEAE